MTSRQLFAALLCSDADAILDVGNSACLHC